MNRFAKQLMAVVSLAAVSAIFAAPASAQTSQCNFTQMGGTLIDFGIVSAANRNDILGIDNINFSCTAGIGLVVNYTVTISSGSSGNFNNRTLQFAGNQLNYNLYVDPTYTQVFGDGSAGSNSASVSGLCANGTSCIVPVYGRINGGQTLRAGQFSDSVVVTVSF